MEQIIRYTKPIYFHDNFVSIKGICEILGLEFEEEKKKLNEKKAGIITINDKDFYPVNGVINWISEAKARQTHKSYLIDEIQEPIFGPYYQPGTEQPWQYGERFVGSYHRKLGPCPACGFHTIQEPDTGFWNCSQPNCKENQTSHPDEPIWWTWEGLVVTLDNGIWKAYEKNSLLNGKGNTPSLAVQDYLNIKPQSN